MQEIKLIKKGNKIYEENEKGLRTLHATITATESDDTGYTIKVAHTGRKSFMPKNWIDNEE